MLARLLATATILTALATPMAAQAATGAIAVTDVNLRAGPSTGYPAVDVVGAGERVRVFGCLSDRSWCDVSFRGIRGWMSSNYLAYATGSQRYTGTRVVEVISAPVISFSIGGYWDDHYRSRPFYRERARYDYRDGPRRDRDWDRPPPPRRGDWDRDRAERDRDRADRERERYDRRDRRDNDRFDPRDGRDFGDRRDRGDRGPRERNEYERAYRVDQPQPIYRVD